MDINRLWAYARLLAIPKMNESTTATPLGHLTTENWLVWSSLFEAKMEILEISEVLHDERTIENFTNRFVHLETESNFQIWREKNKKCLANMKLFVGGQFLPEVVCCNTAFQAWEALRKRVNSLSQLGITSLYSKLHNVKKQSDVSVRAHLDTMNSTRQLLASLGDEHKITQAQWINIVINSIPPTYEFESTIIALGRLVMSGKATIDDVTYQLVEAERVHTTSTEQQQQIAMVSTTSNGRVVMKRRYEGQEFPTRKNRVRCDYCGLKGHVDTECFSKPGNEALRDEYFKRRRERNENRKSTSRLPVPRQVQDQIKTTKEIEPNWPYYPLSAHVTILCCSSITLPKPSVNWYVDSAASRHFTHNKDVFINFRPIENVTVRFGNAGCLYACGVGDVQLNIGSNEAHERIVLHDVMYVPGLTLNLLSVSAMNDEKYWLAFGPPGCFFIDPSGDTVTIATRDPETNLFKLQASSVVKRTSNPVEVGGLPVIKDLMAHLTSVSTDISDLRSPKVPNCDMEVETSELETNAKKIEDLTGSIKRMRDSAEELSPEHSTTKLTYQIPHSMQTSLERTKDPTGSRKRMRDSAEALSPVHPLAKLTYQPAIPANSSVNRSIHDWLELSRSLNIQVDNHVETELRCNVSTSDTINERTNAPALETVLDLWHRRLNHLNKKQSKQLVKILMNLNVEDTSCQVCSSCQFGKAHKQSIPKMTKRRATKPLELIHSDVGGALPVQSIGHSSYYVLFIDDATRYIQVYFMKHKSEVLTHFKAFVTAAELKFDQEGHKVKTLRCDSGMEYLNDAFSQYLKSKGIEIEPSAPYTHECNGVAERANRTLMEAVRALLFDAEMPSTFWAEALLSAVYVRNRCFTQALDFPMTPYEAWTGEPPDISNLRVFGSLVYVHIDEKERNKLEPKAETGVLVGYTPDKLSYRVWMHGSRNVRTCRHITIDESVKGWSKQARIPRAANTPRNELEMKNIELEALLGASHSVPRSIPNAVMDPITQPPASASESNRTSSRVRKPTQPYWHQHPQHLPNHYAYASLTNIDHQAYSESERIHLDIEPTSIQQAMRRPDWPDWLNAIEQELQSLHKAKVWELVEPPPGVNIVGSKPVFKLKRDAEGKIDRYKVRYVAQGYTQRQGIDYNETFAPVAKTASIRALLALAAWHNLFVDQMDVTTAYLNGEIDYPIYMRQPAGSVKPGNEKLVCLLKKSIYGLRQSGRMWYQKMHNELVKQQKFEVMECDHCIYRHHDLVTNTIIWLSLYVDDLLIMSNNRSHLDKFKVKLALAFDMKDMGPARFILGIQITHDREQRLLTITQTTYIKALVTKFEMQNSKPISTPMEIKHGLSQQQCPSTQLERESMRSIPYLSAVGGIMYAMTSTRPDLAFAASVLSRFGSNPGPQHWRAAKRVLQYLNHTSDYSITYHGRPASNSSSSTRQTIQASITGYCDSDWASNTDTRKSVAGYVFVLAGGAVSWSSKSQSTIALSTVEAEYMSYSMASRETMWWRQFLNQLYYRTPPNQLTSTSLAPTVIYADNQGAIALAHNPEFHQRTKHISITWHYIRELVANKQIELQYLQTTDMVADFLTKSLPQITLRKCCTAVGLGSPSTKATVEVMEDQTDSH